MAWTPSNLLACCCLLIVLQCGQLKAQAGNSRKRPNIVILMTDDQDVMLGSMDVMQHTQERIVRRGAAFTNAFTTSPICCPSRSSFLTGLYSHNHNVLTNNDNCSSPQWQREHETRTFATHLSNAGYATGYFGKYLNEYNGSYIPPGWQYWMGLIKNTKYYNYSLRHNNRREQHRDNYEKDYFTDLIVNRSMEYFRRTKREDPDRPILSMLSFPAPHGTEDAAPQYQHLYQNVTSHINPSFDFGPNDDKHWAVSRLREPMDAVQHRFSSMLQQKRLQTLRSVDDGVEKFIQMLEDIGELDNTYLLYTSDHGYHIGQFRIAKGKSMPYDSDIRVPFYLRGPGILQNSSVNQIVLNIDIAPTVLGIAGVRIPEWMDGRNFMPLLNRGSTLEFPWRDTFLVERGKIPLTKIHMARPSLPSKQEKVNQICQRPEFQHPCLQNQPWTCVVEDGKLKMRKCSKVNRPPSNVPKPRKCSCPRRSRVSSKCRNRINHFKRETSNQIRLQGFSTFAINERKKSHRPDFVRRSKKIRRGARRHKRRRVAALPEANWVMGRFSSSSPLCKLLTRSSYNIQCMEGSQEMTPSQAKEYISKLKMNIRILKLYGVCRTLRKDKCKCLRKKENRRKLLRQTSENPMRMIIREINEEHKRRVENFKLLRSEQQTKRQLLKEKQARRKQSGKTCSEGSGVNCFLLNRHRWVVPPLWDGEDRCYCTNSKNNTYWCIRTINETSNLLYCEFVTGFVEYYNMNTDPYQLYNTFVEQSTDTHVALNAELAQLRVCKGARNCHVARNNQSEALSSSNSSSDDASSHTSDPHFDLPAHASETSTPAYAEISTLHESPTSASLNKRKRKRPTCKRRLRRKFPARWKEICRRRKSSKHGSNRNYQLNRRRY